MENNDYIPNKIVRGEWETSDQRWKDYLKKYAEKHNRKEEIEKYLKEVRL